MNSGDNGTLPTELSNAINGTFEPAIDQLKANGNLTTGVGSYSNAIAQMSFASSIGGKNANDDFIAFFNPTDDTAFDWAAAIADGVSGSLLGDVASELACITALSSLAKNPEQIINAAFPISEANRALRQIGSTFENDPEPVLSKRNSSFDLETSFASWEGAPNDFDLDLVCREPDSNRCRG